MNHVALDTRVSPLIFSPRGHRTSSPTNRDVSSRIEKPSTNTFASREHLSLALEAGYLIGEQPVCLGVAESVLSKQIDDLEPTLTRNGYSWRDLAEQFGAKQAEIKAMFRNQLEPGRSKELREQMLAAGLPI